MTKRNQKADDGEDRALLALIALALADGADPPELTDEDRAALDALPADFINRLLAGERPLGRKP